MPSILFNNDNDPSKGKSNESGIAQSSMQTEAGKNENSPAVLKEDDFAIFPQWDVIPPNAIINPRIKKKI